MEHLKLYVDSSYRPKDGACQSGLVYNNPCGNKVVQMSSQVFYADNNNDAEILGAFYAMQDLHQLYGVKKFILYNDNITCCKMLDSSTEVSKHLSSQHLPMKEAREWFSENKIIVKSHHTSRRHDAIKLCDRLSKVFRKKEKYGFL